MIKKKKEKKHKAMTNGNRTWNEESETANLLLNIGYILRFWGGRPLSSLLTMEDYTQLRKYSHPNVAP